MARVCAAKTVGGVVRQTFCYSIIIIIIKEVYTVGSFYRKNLGSCTNWTRCTCIRTSPLVLYISLGCYWALCTEPVPPIFFSRGEQRAICTQAHMLRAICTHAHMFCRSNCSIHMLYSSNWPIHMFYISN